MKATAPAPWGEARRGRRLCLFVLQTLLNAGACHLFPASTGPFAGGFTVGHDWKFRAWQKCRIRKREPVSTPRVSSAQLEEDIMGFGKGALLWLLGIPLPIILLLAIFWR